ncbi:MAG: neutral zinc metallopeptidase [Acidobacteriota bacterium]|nr:neutral zinc metallopeptidase [Acidobacteriota bacterium]
MEWTPGGPNSDVEDRRDESGGGLGGGGFGGFGIGHLGIGGVIIVGLLSLVFHTNLFTLFSGGGQTTTQSVRTVPDPQRDAQEQPEAHFVGDIVFRDIQNTWDRILPDLANRPYHHAHLVLFRNPIPSGCGLAQAAVGPFYCPEDEKVYLDLGFFDELRQRFGAPGQFAQAYVIAHEIGHHVQKILGIEPKVRRLQQANPDEQNPLSVRLELQADCFAGIWAHSTENHATITSSDIDSALGAAAAVGDDRLQRMATGRVSPETFTHGSSAQRTGWFKQGFQNGDIASCNTFQRRQ